MKTPPPARPHGSHHLLPARIRLSLGAAVGLGLLFPSAFSATDAGRRTFDIPAGDATATLKQFAAQSTVQLLYAPDDVQGVPTHAVRGEFTSFAALEQMLRGTPLKARQDEKTKAIAITSNKPSRAPPPTPPISPNQQSKSSQSNQPDSIPVKSRNLITFLTSWLIAATATDAQVVAGTARGALADVSKKQSEGEVDSATVVLAPFLVQTDRDNGWVASSTLIGSRTNQELANLPMSVDAVTAEFMRDLNTSTLEDAAKFVAGLDVTPWLERRVDDNGMSYRGMQIGDLTAAQASRNFFLWYMPTDTYNLERIDFNKGSNSLMFGDASPGGQATTYSKIPRFRTFASLTAQYGSYDSHRSTMDINRKISNTLALRLNMVQRDNRTYINFNDNMFRGLDAALLFRPFKSTQLRVEGEVGRFDYTRADNRALIYTNASPGRGFGTNNRWYYTSDGEILQRTATQPAAAIDRVAASGDRLSFLSGQSQIINLTTLNGNATVLKNQTMMLSGFPRNINLLGINDYLDRPYNNVTFWLNQAIGKLSLEAAYNQQSQNQQRNDSSFGGDGGAVSVSVDSSGRPYLDQNVFNVKKFGNLVRIKRLTASYPLEVAHWMKQYFVATMSWQKDYACNRRYTLANFAVENQARPVPIASHNISVRAYLDSPNIGNRGYWEQFSWENLPRSATFQPGWYETTSADSPFVDVRYQKSYSISANGQYLNGRLHSLMGLRYDKFARKRITILPVDAIGQSIFLGSPDAAPDAYSYDPQFDLHQTSPTTGFLYALTEKLNAYISYSKSFRWQGGENFLGETLGPVLGQTREAGFKGNFLHGKLFYTVASYVAERRNAKYIWSSTALDQAALEDLINPNNLLSTDPGYVHVPIGISNEYRTTTASERSRGVEITLQLLRTNRIQTRFTFAYNKITAAKDFALFQQFYDAAVARTTAANSPGGTLLMAESAAILSVARDILSSEATTPNVTGSRGKPYSGSFVVDYEFPRESRLRGARAGISGRWQSTYVLQTINGVPYRDDSQFPISLYAIYQRRMLGHIVTVRLGIDNVYDLKNGNSEYRHTQVIKLRPDGSPVYQYRYVTPVAWNVNTTVDF